MANMTNNEANDWVSSLKPGDPVAFRYYNEYRILHVRKVTNSGIVRTDEGYSFKNRYGNVGNFGGYGGSIEPVTDENMKIVYDNNAVRKALLVANSLRFGSITPEFAREFLRLCEKHGVKT